ncbi:MAG: hypothetical protein IK092_02290 [Muribaculaceae bacterium]|nr:hypothetical protein [Muribaculaceae bacterium]
MKTKNAKPSATLFPNLSERDFQVVAQPVAKSVAASSNSKSSHTYRSRFLHMSQSTRRTLNSASNVLAVIYLTAFVAYFLYKCF